jgi:hypothetical protein
MDSQFTRIVESGTARKGSTHESSGSSIIEQQDSTISLHINLRVALRCRGAMKLAEEKEFACK